MVGQESNLEKQSRFESVFQFTALHPKRERVEYRDSNETSVSGELKTLKP